MNNHCFDMNFSLAICEDVLLRFYVYHVETQNLKKRSKNYSYLRKKWDKNVQ